jgi:hypothetical protein
MTPSELIQAINFVIEKVTEYQLSCYKESSDIAVCNFTGLGIEYIYHDLDLCEEHWVVNHGFVTYEELGINFEQLLKLKGT